MIKSVPCRAVLGVGTFVHQESSDTCVAMLPTSHQCCVELVAEKANRSMGDVDSSFGGQEGTVVSFSPLQHKETREIVVNANPSFLPSRQNAGSTCAVFVLLRLVARSMFKVRCPSLSHDANHSQHSRHTFTVCLDVPSHIRIQQLFRALRTSA